MASWKTKMWVSPVVKLVTAVAPVTIGTLQMGSYESAYGKTLHSLDVYCRMMELLPRTRVSACEPISIRP
jgi:hypothetical protein